MREIRSFEDVHRVLAPYVNRTRTISGAYSLERMQKAMEKLGNPQDNFKTIHVAGTSGKTSTCYYIAALLGATGSKVGLTISPHIDEINERLQINMQPLPEDQFCSDFEKFLDLVGETGIDLTYFELLIAFAYWEFARQGVDYAVVEVGVGGLLDATNVIHASDKLCVITDIGLDHMHILGKSLPEIAANKAGIIFPGNTVFAYHQADEVMDVIRGVAEIQGADLNEIEYPSSQKLPDNLPLFQKRNWHLAHVVCGFVTLRDELMELSSKQLLTAAGMTIPSRFEIVRQGSKTIVLDGAHNAQKMNALAESLEERFPGQTIAALLAVVDGQDFRARTDLVSIAKLTNHVIITGFDSEKDFPKVSVDPDVVASHCRDLGFKEIQVIEEPEKAYEELLRRAEPVLLVTGSFYLMNHIRPLIFTN